MARVHDEVLSSFAERMTKDERVSDSLATDLVAALSEIEVPSGATLADLIRDSTGDAIE